MTENYNRPPEEVRQEVLGLLGKIKREDFPTLEMYSSMSDRVSQIPGILLTEESRTGLYSSLMIVMPGGIFESGIYSQVLLGSNGKISRFPMRESMREASPESYAEFEVPIKDKLKEIKEKSNKQKN